MKSAKSLLLLVAVTVVSIFGMNNVHAYTQDELKSKISSTSISGTEFKASNYSKEIEDYFKNNKLEDKDINYLYNKVDEVVKIIKDSGAKTQADLKANKTAKNQLKTVASDITANTKVKVSPTGTGLLDVYNVNGTKFGSVSLGNDTTTGKDVAKKTDSTHVTAMASAIVLAGAFIIARRSKANA